MLCTTIRHSKNEISKDQKCLLRETVVGLNRMYMVFLFFASIYMYTAILSLYNILVTNPLYVDWLERVSCSCYPYLLLQRFQIIKVECITIAIYLVNGLCKTEGSKKTE